MAAEHPSQRFRADARIQTGVPLKAIFAAPMVRLIGESMESVVKGFDARAFGKQALSGLDALEFSGRAQQIGRALAAQLPKDFAKAGPLLVKSMGPELEATGGNGLAPFFYLPHSHVIAEHGVEDFETGMRCNYELTKRMTAEFCIRPYIVRHRAKALKMLMAWTKDPNPHVRRLASEGSRSRLPWGMRLREIQEDPQLTIPLLERLKDDDELYVRRSVANHLGDILKDHPETGFDMAEQWLEEIAGKKTPRDKAEHRKWIIRHAVRLPAKKGVKKALEIRKMAAIGRLTKP